jgi:hypothetical protein
VHFYVCIALLLARTGGLLCISMSVIVLLLARTAGLWCAWVCAGYLGAEAAAGQPSYHVGESATAGYREVAWIDLKLHKRSQHHEQKRIREALSAFRPFL